jgi:hypothetical protein
VLPIEAHFNEGRPATAIRSTAISAALHARRLKQRLKHDSLGFPNPINQLHFDARPEL